jgi:hypothetical protein
MPMAQLEAQWQDLANAQSMNPYAIIDSAQDAQLLPKLRKKWPTTESLCLLPDAQGDDLVKVAPHLVALPPFEPEADIWLWLLDEGAAQPSAFTLLASVADLETLHAHLVQFTEIRLPDDDEMFFAFWDPAILGTLVGQPDDTTLHVPGPVFTARQRSRLLIGINGWWYWGRQGQLHRVETGNAEPGAMDIIPPFKLSQVQVDMLVEASVPDHLLANVRENQPQLLFDVPPAQQYGVVESLLLAARRLGLRGMQDITNYICAGLIYGDRMQTDPAILAVLQQVKNKEFTFTEAMGKF